LVREWFMLDVTLPDGRPGKLEAMVTRPAGPGPFPLVVISHGLPRNPMEIALETPESYSGPAILFAQHGYAAVAVNRPGFGRSTGPADMSFGSCADRHYTTAGLAWGEAVLAALNSLRNEPWVDPQRVVLVGHSAGGFAALGAATHNPAGVVGIIDFAGAVGSPRPDFVCQPDRLVAAMHQFGMSARVPSLWIFAANDHFFAPPLVRQMFDAFVAGGAPAELDAAPAFGRDGHLLIFAVAPSPWWPRVADFLDHLHLPTGEVVDLPPPAALPLPPGLAGADADDFTGYVTSRSYEKAFAADASGHYGRAFGRHTQEDAAAVALAHCKQDGGTDCSLYAVGNTLSAAAH
jgi:dienelactone hydrolase